MPTLTQDELEHLLDIYASPARFTAVDIGDEVVLSNDGTGTKHIGNRVQDLQAYETLIGVDMVELWQIDYSYKAIKVNVAHEGQGMKIAQNLLTNPIQYGAMPDLGRYSQPDGPIPNWSELLPLNRIDEARDAQQAAMAMLIDDIAYVADHMVAAGTDGIDMDTTGAAGDADFLAALTACRKLREKYPWLGIEIGMASEFVLGMHGKLTFDGERLAGMWPKDQLRMVQQAGASVYGPAVNINSGKSTAWNIARAMTFIKPAMEIAEIPVHVNVGMGVGGVPNCVYPPADATQPGLQGLRGDPQDRRVLGWYGRPPRDGVGPHASVRHGRDAGSRRSGSPHADDQTHATQGSQAVRGRQARLHHARPQRPRGHGDHQARQGPGRHRHDLDGAPVRGGHDGGQVQHRRRAGHPHQLCGAVQAARADLMT